MLPISQIIYITKQNRGVRNSKSGEMTSSDEDETHVSPKLDRDRFPQGYASSVGMSHPLQMLYGNLYGVILVILKFVITEILEQVGVVNIWDYNLSQQLEHIQVQNWAEQLSGGVNILCWQISNVLWKLLSQFGKEVKASSKAKIGYSIWRSISKSLLCIRLCVSLFICICNISKYCFSFVWKANKVKLGEYVVFMNDFHFCTLESAWSPWVPYHDP